MSRIIICFCLLPALLFCAGACGTSWDKDSSPEDVADDDTGDDDTGEENVPPPERRYLFGVVEYEVGVGGGFGEEFFPGNVLGPPRGFGLDSGNNDAEEVFSLGHGGSITLDAGDWVLDGEGPDFVIFENAFRIGGNDDVFFIEAAFVEVSEDGINYFRFPNDYDPLSVSEAPQAFPGSFRGFAGVRPVFANLDPDGDGDTSDFIDPGDPALSGGDPFDLATLGLTRIRYIRIIDTGSALRAPGTESLDDGGDRIEDQGNLTPPSGNKDGFDLDAVVLLN